MAELETEGELSRSEVADFLREFANELDTTFDGRRHPDESRDPEASRRDLDESREGITRDREGEVADGDAYDAERITLIVGGDSATVTVPDTVEFDVEVESRDPMLGSGVSQEIEFDLSWEIENPDALTDDGIEIE